MSFFYQLEIILQTFLFRYWKYRDNRRGSVFGDVFVPLGVLGVQIDPRSFNPQAVNRANFGHGGKSSKILLLRRTFDRDPRRKCEKENFER